MASQSMMDVSSDEHTESDARVQIQEIIEDLKLQDLNLAEPGNDTLDRKIDKLDRIFTEYVEGDDTGQDAEKGKTIDVSQARLDILAFSMLATINHQRIRRVAASSWTFRAADFANRIVRLVNVEEGSQSETLTSNGKKKLDQMVKTHFNQCPPLRPLLGAIVLTKVETAPKERRQRQPREKDKPVAVQQPTKLTDISEEDQNTKVLKRVEFIRATLKSLYRAQGKKPVSFYHFVLDPTSFSNSVENFFYVSFLLKDGLAALTEESESGLPELVIRNKSNDETQSQGGVTKKQLILGFDFNMWQEMVQGLNLQKAAIPPANDQPAPDQNERNSKRPRL